jgi:uncharacterized protein (TIGR02300 family)
VVKAELGTKRTCPSCAARFYDLLKNPIVCPKCGANFIAPSILPSKGDMPAMAPAPKPREVEADDMETADVELVSLEDAEAPDVADDETAGIEDVDLGDDAEAAEGEDDTFLVEEEEEGDNMSGLLDTGGKEEDEEV